MSDPVHSSYKPLRNYLRGFDVWSGLGATYHYLQYLHVGKALPDSLSTPSTRLGQGHVKAGLHPHLVEILARELILNGQHRGGRPFTTAEASFKAMRMIHAVDDGAWRGHPSHADDILLQLSRIAFQQVPWQISLNGSVMARYFAVYGDSRISPMVETRFGMTVLELFQLVLLLMEEMRRRPTVALEFLGPAEPTIRAPVVELVGRLGRPFDEMRQHLLELQRFDVNWAYTFNPLREFPLLHAGNTHSMICPAPPLLLRRLTDGLFFDLIRSDAGFGEAVGRSFEAYVGRIVKRIGRGGFEMLPEARWAKPERRSADWLIGDPSATMFVECKFARLDVASQTDMSPKPAFLKAIRKLACAVGQLYSTMNEALAGGYPHWQPDGRPIHPVVVTFHEWFAFGPFFYDHLDRYVEEEFRRRGLDAVLLACRPYSVCSIDEFEGLLSAMRENGIDAVLSDKNRPETRQWLMRGFLADRYPGSLRDAAGAFEDDMDSMIVGPSRFTRRLVATPPN